MSIRLALAPLLTSPARRLFVFPLEIPLFITDHHSSTLTKPYLTAYYAMWANYALAAAGVLARIALAADFDWSTIEPSEQLKYHPCYDGYQCARLSVPYESRSLSFPTACESSFLDHCSLAG